MYLQNVRMYLICTPSYSSGLMGITVQLQGSPQTYSSIALHYPFNIERCSFTYVERYAFAYVDAISYTGSVVPSISIGSV